jgi:hypothetical protein
MLTEFTGKLTVFPFSLLQNAYPQENVCILITFAIAFVPFPHEPLVEIFPHKVSNPVTTGANIES